MRMRLSPDATALFGLVLVVVVSTVSSETKLSLAGILEKGGQYKTLLQLLNQTQVGVSVQNQLNNTYDGLTVFAPTDNAFSNLPTGVLNGLSPEDQVHLLNFHVLPKFYTFDTFRTASNPLRTLSPSTLNVTYLGAQQFNVSTGVNTVTISNALNITSPLAVYSADTVLLPYGLFGVNRTTPAPPPSAPGPAPVGKANDTIVNPPKNSAIARAPALVTVAGLLAAILLQ